jgi:hypothetical protein
MFSKATFCTLPWSTILITPSGDFKVCAFTGNERTTKDSATDHGIGLDDNGVVMNIMTHSIKDAMNSHLHKSIRLAQSKNEKHLSCRVCWDKEESHVRFMKSGANYDGVQPRNLSHRIGQSFAKLNEYEGVINIEDAPNVIDKDGSIDNLPIHLDIRFSNLCNSKCIQCNPQYSNMWYSDHIALSGSNQFMMGPAKYTIRAEGNKLVSDMPKWHDTPQWWDQFDLIKSRLRKLYITGGEPFLQPSHEEMLDRLIAGDHAKDINISYDTNLMAINDRVMNKLSNFKSVKFGISIDDTEKRYELIRFPSSWNKLQANMEKIKAYSNLSILLSSCIGIFDIYAPFRMSKHFESLGYKNFTYHLVHWPRLYDIKYLPSDVKKKIIDRYNESDLATVHKSVVVGYLKNNMNVPEEQCKKVINLFIDRMDKLDKLRGTDWKETMPDVVELLKDYL